jgi:glutamyl-Q tRNA(Asp) synthetase
MTTGRFAPSPTGPLHLGSLVAAVGSWLFARHDGGRWLVRMEDLDTPRVIPGSAGEILGALERYALTWDGEVVYQSQRLPLYEAALNELRARDRVFDCACSRADLQRAASAPVGEEPIYPGTCRDGIPDGRPPRAVRFRGNGETDDFIVKRADGVFAYQLAVVVDDAAQEVTQVVRGADLLSSMPRQIALQRALGHPTPEYVHLPLVVGPDGKKLGKRDGALPLPSLDDRHVADTLHDALAFLGLRGARASSPRSMLAEALERLPSSVIAAKRDIS